MCKPRKIFREESHDCIAQWIDPDNDLIASMIAMELENPLGRKFYIGTITWEEYDPTNMGKQSNNGS